MGTAEPRAVEADGHGCRITIELAPHRGQLARASHCEPVLHSEEFDFDETV
jgi:hypothetical protein